MTDTIEQKALALVNQVRAGYGWPPHLTLSQHDCSRTEALCRAIEQHEAFRQEVSDAVGSYIHDPQSITGPAAMQHLRRFIIAKPDPLVEVLKEADAMVRVPDAPSYPEAIRAAIEKRGGKIVWGEG